MFVKSVLVFLSVFSALLTSAKGQADNTTNTVVYVGTNGEISLGPSENSIVNLTGNYVRIRTTDNSMNCSSSNRTATKKDFYVQIKKYLKKKEQECLKYKNVVSESIVVLKLCQ